MLTNDIKLKIHEESDLFTPYDPEQKLLSEEVCAYLIRCYENNHRSHNEDLVVHIISDIPVNEEHVRQAIRDHCEQEMNNIRHEMKVETFKEVPLVILGLFFLTLWFFLSPSKEGIWMEILSIMGSVVIWEAVSIAIMRRPEHFARKKLYERASRAEIVFEVTENTQA